LSKNHGNTFDVRGFAAGFAEALDLRGFAEAFRSAFDLRNGSQAFPKGFRDGADLIARNFRRTAARVQATSRHDDTLRGSLLLQRLVADVAGGGHAAAQALREIRDLMRPYNPRIDAIPDEQVPVLVKRIIEDLEKPAARPEDFSGAVARALAEAQAKAAGLAFAEAAFRAALEERPRKWVPLDWAMTQNNLGNALQTLGKRESGTARLEEAVAAYRAALEEYTRERVPLRWAMTQNNLGNALQTLGKRESGTARLEEAVTAYHAALEERTRERVPLQWAMTQNNLGAALQTLGERESGAARLAGAIAAYDAALSVLIPANAAHYVEGCQANREEAIRLIEERRRAVATPRGRPV
jgi:tetratricopeptide (TPR) repeat protein